MCTPVSLATTCGNFGAVYAKLTTADLRFVRVTFSSMPKILVAGDVAGNLEELYKRVGVVNSKSRCVG